MRRFMFVLRNCSLQAIIGIDGYLRAYVNLTTPFLFSELRRFRDSTEPLGIFLFDTRYILNFCTCRPPIGILSHHDVQVEDSNCAFAVRPREPITARLSD